MNKGNDYPRMLYPGGDTSQKGRIVRDEDAEQAASKEGYARAGEQTTKAPAPKKPGRPKKGT